MAMRVRIVSIVAGLLVVAVPVSAASASDLSLRSNKRSVVFKQHAQLSGRLSSGGKGVRVLLQADRFPFDHSRTIAKTSTNATGRFGFQVRPKLGTNYRAVLMRDRNEHSKLARVFVLPSITQSCNVCGSNAPTTSGPKTLLASITFDYPKHTIAQKLIGRDAYFYYGQRDGGGTPARLKLRKRKPLKSIGPRGNKASFSYDIVIPASVYSLKIGLCVRDSFKKTGLGLVGHHRCGDKRIPYDYSYLGRSSTSGPSTAARLLP